MLSEKAAAWFRARKIDPAIAEAHDISSVDRAGGEWLAFPYQRDGRHVTNKYRRIAPEKGFSQDAEPPFKSCWNEDALKLGEGPVIITEGEVDALVFIQCGFERVISVPDGAPNNEVADDDSPKWAYVPDLLNRLRGEKVIILAVDGDENGSYLRNYLAKRLGKARCKWVRYPQGSKDANDVLLKQGVDAVKALISGASWISVPGVVKVADMPPVAKPQVFRVGLGGRESGFDRHIALLRKQLSAWTGVPGHGKSTLVNAVCWEAMRQHRWRFGIGCFEDDVQEDYRTAMACYIGNRPEAALEPDHWALTDQRLNEHFCFFVEDEETNARMTIDWLLEKMETAVVRHGSDMIVIDPWSKLDHTRDRAESEGDYTGRVLNDLKRFARKFDVHVAVVAHPRKVQKKSDGSYEVPGGYDISGSAHWYNMVDLGVTAYREITDTGDTIAKVISWKVKRHRIMGKPGAVALKLDPETGRYSDYYDQGRGS
ncbi:MAG: AAA family ATPase [Pseudomonadota bacterium]|nr:AAA family ATPase [Pseudomonadota bacterium]